MKGTVGIVDFHAATNYGSALLAYALQRVVSDMGYDCIIINYQPKKQADGYRLPILVSRHPVKRWVESLFWLPYSKQMKRKVSKFKAFARNYMHLTPYCCDPSRINEQCGTFDYYIAGGDQIWNTGCFEFEWYYYLDFVKNGKKIAYAPSMGPAGKKAIPVHLAERVRKEVDTYQAVSVRDSGTAAFFDSKPPVVLDPTMLLDVEEWNKLAGDKPLIEGEYVFYYDPFDHEVGKNVARKYAVEHGCRIVSSNIYQIFQKDARTFDYRLDVGPLEFLNLVKYAKYCIGRSFHLCVFSLLFRKEFQMVDGLSDARNRELAESLWGDVERLRKAGGNDMIVSAADYTAEVDTRFGDLRESSLLFLSEALN